MHENALDDSVLKLSNILHGKEAKSLLRLIYINQLAKSKIGGRGEALVKCNH